VDILSDTELEDRFDLFKPEFAKVCLNRNRLLEYGYEDCYEEPQVNAHGTVLNVLAEFRR